MSGAFVINVTYDSSVANAPAGFTSAVTAGIQYLESQFTDPITININVGWGEVGGSSLDPGGLLGGSLAYLSSYTYTQIRNALAADAKTGDDTNAVASLPTNAPVSGTFWLSTAQAKAVGLMGASVATDGFVGFNSSVTWDFNSSDGVTGGQYDFFATFVHEITHVMGRSLATGGTIGGINNSYELLDLFHYSASGTRTFSGATAGYFSVDGGVTNLNNFNTFGGGDPGDWASSAGSDAFLAFNSSGVANAMTPTDVRVMDAIGWDAAPSTQTADLTVSGLTLNGTTLTWQVNNAGTAAAATSTTGIYLSTDSTIASSDLLLTTVAAAALAAGASDIKSLALTLPSLALVLPNNLTPGTYYLGTLANYDGQVSESNVGNDASSAIVVVLGNSGDNSLTSTPGASAVFAMAGNDTLNDGGNAVVLYGGGGDDAYFVSNSSTQVIENANKGWDVISSSVNYTLPTNVEELVLTGNGVTGTGNSGDNVLYANGSNDILAGGAGNDSYYVSTTATQVIESAGQGWDVISSSVNYMLPANVEELVLTGNGLTGTGNSDDNVLYANGSNDILAGGAGNDSYYVSNSATQVIEKPGEGTWDIIYSSVDYTLPANVESLVMQGDGLHGTGNAADNVFYVLGSNDVLIGGAGNDTAVFSGDSSAYVLYSFNGVDAILSHGATGADRLQGIEHIQFDDKTVSASSAPVFDAYEYIASYGDLIQAFGANAQAGFDHFVNYGFSEGRSTNLFDALEYIASNPDLIVAFGANASAGAQHYDQFGFNEHRSTNSFNALEYIASNPDLIAAFGANAAAGVQHYDQFGFNEHRITDSFDAIEYIASNPDLIAAFGNNPDAGVADYVQSGFNEHRSTNSFDAIEYIASNADLITAFGNNPDAGAAHYVQYGVHEGRSLNSFNAEQYLANYQDLQAAFGDDPDVAAAHYVQNGVHEGRTDHALPGGNLGVFNGNSGNNTMVVGNGDTMTGGAGNDAFVFKTALTSAATITDFTHGADTLDIQLSGFGLTSVSLVVADDISSVSLSGPKGYFIFDNAGPNIGTLYFDATGGNGADATAIAHLNNVTSLTGSDFHLL